MNNFLGMKIGTRSILFGVHQFLWHPLTVGLAWRRIHKVWPTRFEWLAIFLHDLGYWGCPDMDGESGRQHPARAAKWGRELGEVMSGSPATGEYVESLIAGHSRNFCRAYDQKPSKLCAPDKVSILYDPALFYWLRGVLSGEIFEYHRREEIRRKRSIRNTWEWLLEYRRSVRSRFNKVLQKEPKFENCSQKEIKENNL